MSWSLFALPLHKVAADGGLTWAATADFSHGVPDRVPEPQPLPRVCEVLDGFRSAGCHGTPWFDVDGLEAGSGLPMCPDPITCASKAGLDLGEVSLHVAGKARHDRPLAPDALVETVSFRKPSGQAALHAVCALTAVAGPMLVCDDSAAEVIVVWPKDRAAALSTVWRW